MLPYRAASVCDYCRLRRRRCDRIRPKCSFCVSQGAECVYGQPADSQPSQLVQELTNIRERLEAITPLLESRLRLPTLPNDTPSAAFPPNCPPLVIKSPHAAQILGLPPDLASVIYRLESVVPQISGPPIEPVPVGSCDFILRRFQDQVHQWYPVLHSDFTLQFFESSAAGFPPSAKSCLSLLVASIASLGDTPRQTSYYEAALSMVPIVIGEFSVTSLQCLVLFSIYFAGLPQPRQAYEYIQAAFLKLQAVLKSEISMHLNLSPLSKTLRGQLATIPLPTSTDLWDYFDDINSPSSSSLSGIIQSSEEYSPTESLKPRLYLPTEVNIQLALNSYASSETEILDTCNDGFPQASHTAGPSRSRSPLFDNFSACNGPDSPNTLPQYTNDPICRAKYHLYEISIYWPMIYRIIMNGSADAEILPSGPLFFESVSNFLSASNIALWVCPPKAWFFCASIYIVCIAAVRALEVRTLRLLAQPRTWESLELSVESLERPSELSPSVQYMRDSLRDRLDKAKRG
ncbi:hypothetical protein BDV10DRAFT_200151 [Aspergillus recurvatus]